MSNLINRDEIGSLEGAFTPRSLLSLSIFGFRLSCLFASSRRAKMTGKRVAIIILHHDSAWERRAVKGIVVSMMNCYSPEEPPLFDVFSAENSSQRLNEEIMPIIEQNKKQYAAIITSGPWVSSGVKTYMTEHKMTLPQVFLGVQDPVGAGLIKNFEIPQAGIVGVNNAAVDYDYCVTVLKEIFPVIKTVLVPYDSTTTPDTMDLEKRRLVDRLKYRELEVRLLPVDVNGDVPRQIAPHLAGVNVLWTVEEPLIQMHAKKLSRLCGDYSVLFCSGELASVFQGADIGWGDSGSLQGLYAGQLCFAVSIGIPTVRLKNIEVMNSATTRTNPNFSDGCALSDSATILIRDVIPLGWE